MARLRIELGVWRAKAHEAREQRLVKVAVLLERHVLDHGRQLVVIPDQDHALEPRNAVLLLLCKRCASFIVSTCFSMGIAL